jgi:hypothetical protein
MKINGIARTAVRLIAALVFSGPIVWGCSSGGGGSDNGSTPPPPVQTPSSTVIKGTVPGTIIHAFGDDGSYYRTETNTADPPPRPFSLDVKPGIGYRLVLDETGVLYPVTFLDGRGGTNTRFYMSLVGVALDLGLVTPDSITGRATPQHNPLATVDSDGDSVPDLSDPDFAPFGYDPLDSDGDGLPNAVDPDYQRAPDDTDGDGITDAKDLDIDNDGTQNADDTDVSGVPDSIDTLLGRAANQVIAVNLVGAYYSFQEIVTRDPNHELGNLGLAVTRIGAVLTDFTPGTDATKLETMKEILDRAGVAQEGRDLSYFWARPPILDGTVTVNYGGGSYSYPVSCYVLPPNAPTPNELRAYLNERLVPQIEAAVGNLDKIGPNFSYTPPSAMIGGAVTGEVDYADVLALKAALRSVLAAMTFLSAYDIEIDLDEFLNNEFCEEVDPNTYHGIDAEAFLAKYPTLMTLANASVLSSLRGLVTDAIDDVLDALDVIHDETDDQSDDLLTIDPSEYGTIQAYFVALRATLDGPVVLSSASGTGRPFMWNSAPIFSGINLRNYIPAVIGNQVVYRSIRGAGYDPTIGGVLPDFVAEDVVKLFDHRAPVASVVGVTKPTSNSFSLTVQVDDTETLPNGTMQIGAGVDPTTFSMSWGCYPSIYDYQTYTGCTLTGQSGGASTTTSGSSFDITLFFGTGSAVDGVYSWTPSGGAMTMDLGGATSVNNWFYSEVGDLAGNHAWDYLTQITVP